MMKAVSFCRLRILAQDGQSGPVEGTRGKIIHIPEASALILTHLSYPRQKGSFSTESLNTGSNGFRQQLCSPTK